MFVWASGPRIFVSLGLVCHLQRCLSRWRPRGIAVRGVDSKLRQVCRVLSDRHGHTKKPGAVLCSCNAGRCLSCRVPSKLELAMLRTDTARLGVEISQNRLPPSAFLKDAASHVYSRPIACFDGSEGYVRPKAAHTTPHGVRCTKLPPRRSCCGPPSRRGSLEHDSVINFATLADPRRSTQGRRGRARGSSSRQLEVDSF